MTVSRDPDSVVADWLAEGPSELPVEIHRAITSGVKSRRQSHERVVWRGFTLDIQRLSVAVGVAAFVLVFTVVALPLITPPFRVGVVASPSATPSPTPHPLTVFLSGRHGYSLQYPADWRVVRATAPWPLGRPDYQLQDPAYDSFMPPLGAEYASVQITSQRVPAGISVSDWLAAFVASYPETFRTLCIPPISEWDSVSVGGVGGSRFVDKCNSTFAIAITGGRAYLFRISGYSSETLAVFDQMLATVTFRPQAANDSPVPSPTPAAGSPTP
jgi:hypothetical protein